MRIEADRIAIVKLGAIGDVVNSLPFANRLRAGYPRARITWVIAPLAHALVQGHAAVDEFLVVDPRRASTWPSIVRALRERHFDLAIDLQRILKSGLLVRASGARARLGFDRARCKEESWVFTNVRIPPNPEPGVTVEQYLELADFLECPPAPPRFDLPFEPFPPPAAGEMRIVVHVGATKPANRWEHDKWAELCRRLVREVGATLHFTGTNGERNEIETLVARAGLSSRDAIVHAGDLTLKQTAGLIRSSRLFVGGDTGPLHIAAALETPVVALFGAADPARTGPFGQPHGVVTHAVPCSPCRRRDCNVAGHPCMRDLDVAPVLERVRARLAERPHGDTASADEDKSRASTRPTAR
jgi:ADP-heptose:LPS heptosyltransferase